MKYDIFINSKYSDNWGREGLAANNQCNVSQCNVVDCYASIRSILQTI